MLPLVESGELIAVCIPCGRQAGKPIGIHPRTMDVLIQRDQVAEAWQFVRNLNAGIIPSNHPSDKGKSQVNRLQRDQKPQ
jgi:hypothetical protein